MSSVDQSSTSTVPKWRVIGPGLVVAATGVGAADPVATLIAGQKFGYTLLWCVVVGCLMKISLVEGRAATRSHRSHDLRGLALAGASGRPGASRPTS